MALTGCYAVFKYLLLLVNVILWVTGIAVLGLAVWLLTDETVYVKVAQDSASTYTGIYVLLAAGSLMFIIGFIGCCGALKESPCMLVTFFCFLLIILVAEIAACVWIYSNRTGLEQLFNDNVKEVVQKEYGFALTKTKAFDAIQAKLKCCGAVGPTDYATARYNQANQAEKKGILDMALSSSQTYNLPISCCAQPDKQVLCETAAKVGFSAVIPGVMYNDGCIEKIKDILSDHMAIAWGLIIGVLLVEVFGLLVSIVLCCAIRSIEDYKS